MPVKRYGIYLAYNPTVEMRGEGLGRHLAALLRAARNRDDVRFVIACPSWSRESLTQLCESERIDPQSFDVVGPSRKPALLRLYEAWKRRRTRGPRRWRDAWDAAFARIAAALARIAAPWQRTLVGSRSMWPLVVAGGVAALVAALVVPFVLAWALLRRAVPRASALAGGAARRVYAAVAGRRADRATRELLAGGAPQQVPAVVALYRQMQDVEIEALHRAVAGEADVTAWFCPTAFWPSVTELDVPHLVCVPDVVLVDFPATFSGLGGDRLLDTYRQIEITLRRGRRFVTYSPYVKEATLVRRFGVDPRRVAVVAHGAVWLDPLISVAGSAQPEAATDALAHECVRAVLQRFGSGVRPGALGHDARFLFYASQFRPHKNVVNLLRACAHLLRRRYLGCKLVLTGNPAHAPEVGEFVSRLDLQEEVLCLPGLSPQELAAFYRLATLSVNPSLFEGGLPFTYSESISVGTPVVMARIPVTEEAITDEALKRDMLFDPHDWRDIADRIEWALANREPLLLRQREYFERAIAPRTWTQALDDYVKLLDRVAAESAAASA